MGKGTSMVGHVFSAIVLLVVCGGNNWLFAATNASLHLRNITVGQGNAICGAAIAATSGSRLSFSRVVFRGRNIASVGGGAIHLTSGSNVTLGEKTVFSNNTGSDGGALYITSGALYVTNGSSIVWSATSHFLNNTAHNDGGDLVLPDLSNASWDAVSNLTANSAQRKGGALFVEKGSRVVWTAESHFVSNNARDDGGALHVRDGSSIHWAAISQLFGNTAENNGGAVGLSNGCSGVWNATLRFFIKNANRSLGALRIMKTCNAVWIAASDFIANNAGKSGGALNARVISKDKWTASSNFSGNTAWDEEGALYLWQGSSASWTAVSLFFGNSAGDVGGPLNVGGESNVTWTASPNVSGNTARTRRGTSILSNGCNGVWGTISFFSSNDTSTRSGGPVKLEYNSITVWIAPLHFHGLSAGASGGAILLWQDSNTTSTISTYTANEKEGSLHVSEGNNVTSSPDLVFSANNARYDGGAVYAVKACTNIWGDNVRFINNKAENGDGIFVNDGVMKERSGNTDFMLNFVQLDDGATGSKAFELDLSSTTNSNLRVVGSEKSILSRTGDTIFVNITCGDKGGGMALVQSSIVFFDSKNTIFLHNSARVSSGAVYLENIGIRTPSTSIGGTTTVEQLKTDKGYWRVTNTSTNIDKCFKTKAYGGGVKGSPDDCLPGYEGPCCSVCSKTYVSGMSFSCQKCPDRAISITIVAIFIVLATAFGLATVSFLVSAEGVGGGRRMAEVILSRVPTHSVKIVNVVWQILTQFISVANMTFPNAYQRFLEGVNFLNFDLIWTLSIGCVLDVDFHDRLLWTTIVPVVMMGLLGGTYAVAVRQHRRTPETVLRDIRHNHVSTALLVMSLVYSSVSSGLFQMFACDDFDDDKLYLRADYRLKCDSPKHRALQLYAGLMILLYPVGIPGLYAFLLFRNRHILRDPQTRKKSYVVRPMSDLWKPYKSQRFYYEVIECGRRIMLTGVVACIPPNTATQIAVSLPISVAFMIVSEVLAPHESHWDAWISRMGHIIIFASMYVALLLKVDVSGESTTSQKTFEIILIVANGCMIIVVLVEAVFIALSLRAERHTEDPTPKLRNSSSFRRRTQTSLAEDEDARNEFELI